MIIRVDPVILKQNSGSISGIGSSVNSSGQSASSVAQGAPSYDGQFGPRVQAIGHEALARAQGLLGAMNNLSSQLLSKAQAFAAADMAAVTGCANINTGAQIPATGPWWTNLPIDILNLYLKLGGLFGGAAFTGLVGTVLLGNGLNSGNGQIGIGFGKPIWWPVGAPWPFGGKQPVKSSEPVPSPIKTPQQVLDISKIKLNQLIYKDVIMNSISGETLANYGCLMTVIAMIARANGVEITPIDVDKWMDSHNYYSQTGGSYMTQGQEKDFLNEVLDKNASITSIYLRNPTQNGLAAISVNINSGSVILHIDSNINPKDGHYVLATGLDKNGNYICIDPNGGVETTVEPNQIRDANIYK